MSKPFALQVAEMIQDIREKHDYNAEITVRWSFLESAEMELRRLHSLMVDAPRLRVAAILVVRAHETGCRLDESIAELRAIVRPGAPSDHFAGVSKMIEQDLFADASNMVVAAAATQEKT